jgi:hypothetical protein
MFMGYDAVKSGRCSLTFRGNSVLPFSGSYKEPSNQETDFCMLLAGCSCGFLFLQTAWHHAPKESTTAA